MYSILFVEQIQTLQNLQYRLIYIYTYTLTPMLAFKIKQYIIKLRKQKDVKRFLQQ